MLIDQIENDARDEDAVRSMLGAAASGRSTVLFVGRLSRLHRRRRWTRRTTNGLLPGTGRARLRHPGESRSSRCVAVVVPCLSLALLDSDLQWAGFAIFFSVLSILHPVYIISFPHPDLMQLHLGLDHTKFTQDRLPVQSDTVPSNNISPLC